MLLCMLSDAHRRTRNALYWMGLAGEPFVALITLLPFIMRKGLGASMFELSVFTAVRPVISVFSFYWGSNLSRQPEKLKTNLMLAWFLSRLPFLLLPLFPTVWYAIFATACYQLFYRAGTPALMEILKINVAKTAREKLFTAVYVVSFLESVALSLFLGKWLDSHNEMWIWLFFAGGSLSLVSMIFQARIPIVVEKREGMAEMGLKERLINPWRDSYHLIKTQPRFAHFQWCFMFGGFGLMLIAPALPVYMVDVLKVNYSSVSIARCLWMAVGVTISSSVWQMVLSRIQPHKMTSIVCLGFALYPFALLVARFEIVWFYLAFLLYGIAQAGSHLLWNLSGTLFAGEGNSSKYTTVNILTVGLRGLIAPTLGGIICAVAGPTVNLVLGSGLCLFGAWYMYSREKSLAEA
jgi:hypothetical protein